MGAGGTGEGRDCGEQEDSERGDCEALAHTISPPPGKVI
jgi:hypothetical protein